jgi:hypothetical protein
MNTKISIGLQAGFTPGLLWHWDYYYKSGKQNAKNGKLTYSLEYT